MSIHNQQEREVTQQKLRWLSERVAALQQEAADNPRVRELSVRSLRKMIKQLKEEIARFEARVSSSANDPGRVG